MTLFRGDIIVLWSYNKLIGIYFQMKSLEDLCIKIICNRITRISRFLVQAQIPQFLKIKISREFRTYKWLQIKQESDKSDHCDAILLDFEYETKISPELRDTLLNFTYLDVFTEHDLYCLISKYYHISPLGLKVCEECFQKYFKLMPNINYTFHEEISVSTSENLTRFYNSEHYWCQNDFEAVVFILCEYFECLEAAADLPY